MDGPTDGWMDGWMDGWTPLEPFTAELKKTSLNGQKTSEK
jgi:hypothetical protein